ANVGHGGIKCPQGAGHSLKDVSMKTVDVATDLGGLARGHGVHQAPGTGDNRHPPTDSTQDGDPKPLAVAKVDLVGDARATPEDHEGAGELPEPQHSIGRASPAGDLFEQDFVE